jgi:hypothetical protein
MVKTLSKDESAKEQGMKYVRVDEKTTIMVAKNISDREAINNYFLKQQENRRKFDNRQIDKRWEQFL